MNIKLISTAVFGLAISANASAMPSSLDSKVHLKSFTCGDSCYIVVEPSDVMGVTIAAWCGDSTYCENLFYKYEASGEDEINLENQLAFVSMQKIKHSHPDKLIYEITKLKLLK